MKKLYERLKNYTIEDAYKFEGQDRQFLALKELEKDFEDKNVYLAIIVANAIICYQLSGKGENYWEEFSKYFSGRNIGFFDIIKELGIFIKQSKNNKRFVDTKIKRLEKLKGFLKNFDSKKYFENMILLRNNLANSLNQKQDAKTIVFAVKMFSYGARNIYGFKKFPKEISIPIDSRLTNIFENYKENYTDVVKFYEDLSEKLNIPQLHLDAILWVNYNELIKD